MTALIERLGSLTVIRLTFPDLNRKEWPTLWPATVSVNVPAQVLPLTVRPFEALQLRDTVTLPWLTLTVFGAAWTAK